MVAHSAGSWVARRAANMLLNDMPYLTINIVLVDPFIPGMSPNDKTGLTKSFMTELSAHQHNDRIYRLENYYAVDFGTDADLIFNPGGYGAWYATSQTFPWSGKHINGLRVDIDPILGTYFGSSLLRTYGEHDGPIDFYTDTVLLNTSPYTTPYWLTFTREWDISSFGFSQSLVDGDAQQLPKIVKLEGQPVQLGNTATLSVSANRWVSYQWYKDGQPCCSTRPTFNSTGATLTIPAVTEADNGDYVVRVTNAHGHTFSQKVTLKASASPPPTITDVNPTTLDALPLPQTQPITITGTGFNSTSVLTFDDGVKLYLPSVPASIAPTQLTYNIKVGPYAGTWQAWVTTDGIQSQPYTFYVQEKAAAPVAPTTPSASDGLTASKVGVAWSAVAGAQTYQVFRCSTALANSCTLFGSTNVTDFDDATGTLGATFYYRVKACNGIGCSDFSAYDTGYRGGTGVPLAPTQVAASDGSYPSGVLVFWSSVSGADSYEVWRATSLTGTKTRVVNNFLYTTYADVQVVAGRTYYYWIKACNYAGSCSLYSGPETGYVGTSASSGPITAINPIPSTGDSTISIKQGSLTWESGGGATSFDVYWGTSPTPGAAQFLRTTQSTTVSIPDLAYNTTYYWRIDAKANGVVTTGTVWQFTTRAQSIDLPERAVNPSPAHSTRDLYINTTTSLNWSNGGGATSYDVYFGKNFQPGAAQYVGNTTATSWSLPTLAYGNHYYWMIKSRNAAGTAKGDIWAFTTEPSAPYPVITPQPADKSTNLPTHSFNLAWSSPGVTATSFDVYFGTNPNPGTAELQGNTIQQHWFTPQLQRNTTYYWRILARNHAGTTLGPVWSFTTWSTSPGLLDVSELGYSSVGPVGGPFSASFKNFTVLNIGEQALTFSVANTRPWLTLSKSSGTLLPGEQTTVTATLTPAAAALAPGYYSDAVVFTNGTNSLGSTARAVSLAVGVPLESWDLSKVRGEGLTALAVKSDGSLYGWGSNGDSVLGLGDSAQPSSPAPIRIGTRSDFADVELGYKNMLALTKDGRLLAWGANNYGQLGLGDLVSRTSPTQVGTDSDWVRISTSGTSSLAIKSNGQLFGFGVNNDSYQLGLGDMVNRLVPSRIGTDSDWVDACIGWDQGVAIKSDGRMFAWGWPVGASGRVVKTPTQVGSLSDWKSVSCTTNQFAALRRNGTLYVSGSNGNGQLGLGDLNSRYVPTQIGTDSDWIAVAVGDIHGLALKQDGRLYGWGNNGYGQLGLGDLTDRLTPTLILQNPNIETIAVTSASSYMTLKDGSLFAWGLNNNGQLGVGRTWLNGSDRVTIPTLVDLDWAQDTKSAQTLTLSTAPSTLTVGENSTLVATASSGLIINISSSTTDVCTVRETTVTAMAVGICSLVVDQLGDEVYKPATALVHDITVGQGAQSISFGVTPTLVVGSTGQVNAVVGASGNPVMFTSTTPTVCTASGTNGSTVTALAVGNCIIAANQAGNDNYTAALQATQTIVVSAGTQSVAFGSAPTLSVGGTGTVTATGGASGNAVTFTSTTPLLCSVAGSTVTALAVGNCIVAANQAGSTNYAAALQATQTIAISVGAQSVTFGSSPTLAVGGTGTVTVTGGASGNPVTFTSTTPLICTVSGTNGSTVTALAAGNCVIAANQAGNANYSAAPQATQTIAISAGAQSVSFGLAPSLAVGGTGTVTATGGASGNPVTFTSTTPVVCTVSGANGSTVTALAAGNCVIAANQAANANYTAAPQATQTIVVSAGAQSVTFGLAPTLAVGGAGTVTATGGASGNAVTFTSNTPLICTVGGTDGSTVTALAAGNCVIAANQAASTNYTAALQATQTIMVSAGAQSVTFGLAPSLAVGGTGTVTATGGASGNPITFATATPSVCSVTGSTVTALTAGDCTITANQAGNANYTAAPQATQTLTIGKTGLDLLPGWNLLGNASDQPVAVDAVFADKTQVNTVWKWDAAKLGWQFYTPTLSAAALQTYADGKNYGVLTSINPGEGFWVNASAKVKTTLPAFAGAPFYLVAGQLVQGWNLVATAANATPAAFNLSLTDPLAPPPTIGSVPLNLTTLWAWDNPASKWYFYAPNLEGQGGTALFDYTAGKGYLDFSANSKTLGAGMGFWVNRP